MMKNRRFGYTPPKADVYQVAKKILALPQVQEAISLAIRDSDELTGTLAKLATNTAASLNTVDPAISDSELEFFVDSVIEDVWRRVDTRVRNG